MVGETQQTMLRQGLPPLDYAAFRMRFEAF